MIKIIYANSDRPKSRAKIKVSEDEIRVESEEVWETRSLESRNPSVRSSSGSRK
jgi:hypothetical protein